MARSRGLTPSLRSHGARSGRHPREGVTEIGAGVWNAPGRINARHKRHGSRGRKHSYRR